MALLASPELGLEFSTLPIALAVLWFNYCNVVTYAHFSSSSSSMLAPSWCLQFLQWPWPLGCHFSPIEIHLTAHYFQSPTSRTAVWGQEPDCHPFPTLSLKMDNMNLVCSGLTTNYIYGQMALAADLTMDTISSLTPTPLICTQLPE
ncbi:hypothetical protein HPG69_005683 [Diceros bicornis minor]|uniref:Uncharacterized protein n=1 Tax=Diceros bicornis minor TaxID=77932 RepID=A0A7J7ES91_DICBM|nr:hypothetical protein HPG69_005683 [Diceros bicornis minor]